MAQVVAPLKSQTSVITVVPQNEENIDAEKQEKRFRSNWISEITIDLFNKKTGAQRRIVTNQGNFYMLLWSGEIKWIDESSTPTVPVLLSDAIRNAESNFK